MGAGSWAGGAGRIRRPAHPPGGSACCDWNSSGGRSAIPAASAHLVAAVDRDALMKRDINAAAAEEGGEPLSRIIEKQSSA